ncbi:carboxypeptidase-like regulatory domain-containing protein [Streptomyces sp. NPDC096057]|uniref:carboxypeptidase-like regulatory domain-containing protein n=1 Tax=Streptomyces sp. NPDC096057 TaxID=3155543 RepID=UPI003320A2B3
MSFIERTTVVSVEDTTLRLAPTVRYRVCLKPRGFALGKHLYSTTLVPGEEVEVEVFRSSKVTDELSRESSVEETFSQELSSTVQNEWSRKQGSNFKIGGGVSASLNLGIFSVGGHVEPEYSTQEETFQKSFAEFVTKTQAKVDRKFDIHMDTKTETVESTRSTRTLRNFNQCQPVTYNYFQLARKVHLEMAVDEVTFDFVRTDPHPLLATRFDGVLNVARFVPPKPSDILAQVSAQPPAGLRAVEAANGVSPPTSVVAQATVQHAVVAADFDQPVRNLTLEQLRTLPLPLQQAERDALIALAQRVSDRFPAGAVVHTSDFCVNSPGTTVEAFTGQCIACDTHTALVQEAERDKLRLDLLKAQQDRLNASTVHGFVRTISGPLAGAVVRLRKQSGDTVVSETVTDADGLYVLAVKGLVSGSDMLVLDVPVLPASLASVQPPNAKFKPGDVPVQVDFVAG